MKSSTGNVAKAARDIAYYRQRYRNRVFEKVVSFITEQAQQGRLTKKDIAERLGKDPALLSRLLNQPSNLTLDTISDLLLAFDAEAEPPEIVLFREKRAPNYVHPLIAKVLNVESSTGLKAESSGAREGNLSLANPRSVSVQFETMAG